MWSALYRQFGSRLVLTFLSICCLPIPASSDEMQYLPNNAHIIMSINLTAAMNTKMYPEFMKTLGGVDPFLTMKGLLREDDWLTKFANKFSRSTMAVVISENQPALTTVAIYSAANTVKMNDIKNLTKHPSRKNVKYTVLRHGDITIYQETFQRNLGTKLGPVQEGQAYFLAEDGKYVVSATHVPALKKIIDRNKAAVVSPVMQSGLKDAGFSDTVMTVVDFQNMPAGVKGAINRTLRGWLTFANIRSNLDNVRSLSFKINESDNDMLTATLACKDAASADVFKTIGDQTLAHLKDQVNEIPKIFGKQPRAAFQKYMKGGRTALNAVRITAADNKVTVALEFAPDSVGASFGGIVCALTAPKAKPAPK